MMFVSFNSNTTGFTCWAGTANTSGAHEFTLRFLWGWCCSIISVMFVDKCLSFVVCHFLLVHCIGPHGHLRSLPFSMEFDLLKVEFSVQCFVDDYLSFFVWSLYCLTFFEWPLLICTEGLSFLTTSLPWLIRSDSTACDRSISLPFFFLFLFL
jgi:hypothetical protein